MNLPAPSSHTEFKDRRNALLVMGIIEIVMGFGAWLMVGLMMLATTMTAQQGVAGMGSIIPGIVFYGLGGAAFMMLGIGSIRARRWARAIWIVLSAGWLLVGVFSVVGSLIWMPQAMSMGMAGAPPQGQGGPPPGFALMLTVFITVFLSILMIGIPLGIFLFYRSPHVRATCVAAQPEPDWTDACPLPVLGVTLWLAVMAAMLLAMPFAYGGMFPLFGLYVGGGLAMLLWWFLAAGAGVAAVGLYRLRAWAWWLALAMVIVGGVSATVTYAVADVGELGRAMGLQGQQLEMMEKMGFTKPAYMIGTTLGATLPYLVLLLWARRHLRREEVTDGSDGGTTAGV